VDLDDPLIAAVDWVARPFANSLAGSKRPKLENFKGPIIQAKRREHAA
jgi:hypothetical protein